MSALRWLGITTVALGLSGPALARDAWAVMGVGTLNCDVFVTVSRISDRNNPAVMSMMAWAQGGFQPETWLVETGRSPWAALSLQIRCKQCL